MKKYTVPQLISLLAAPLLTVLLGLVLLFSPDTASALFGKLLGWCCILGALAFAFSARKENGRWGVIGGIILGALGVWMLLNPLVLAGAIGRILGLALFGWGVGAVRRNFGPKITPGLAAAGAVALLGLVLFLLPMAATRLALNLTGIVIICIGVAEGIDRIRGQNLLDEGDDPNIIDVEKI